MAQVYDPVFGRVVERSGGTQPIKAPDTPKETGSPINKQKTAPAPIYNKKSSSGSSSSSKKSFVPDKYQQLADKVSTPTEQPMSKMEPVVEPTQTYVPNKYQQFADTVSSPYKSSGSSSNRNSTGKPQYSSVSKEELPMSTMETPTVGAGSKYGGKKDALFWEQYGSQMDEYSQTQSKVEEINRARNVQLFQWENGKIIINPNLPNEKSRQEAMKLAGQYGLDLNKQYSPNIPLLQEVGGKYIINPYLPAEYKGEAQKELDDLNYKIKAGTYNLQFTPPENSLLSVKERGNLIEFDGKLFRENLTDFQTIGEIDYYKSLTPGAKQTYDLGVKMLERDTWKYTTLSEMNKYIGKGGITKEQIAGVNLFTDIERGAYERADALIDPAVKLFTGNAKRDDPLSYPAIFTFETAGAIGKFSITAIPTVFGGIARAGAQAKMSTIDLSEGKYDIGIEKGIKAGQEGFEPAIIVGSLAVGVFPGLKSFAMEGLTAVTSKAGIYITKIPYVSKAFELSGKAVGSTLGKLPGISNPLVSSAYMGTGLAVGGDIVTGQPLGTETVKKAGKYTGTIIGYRLLSQAPFKYDSLKIQILKDNVISEKTLYRGFYYTQGERPITVLFGKAEKGFVLGTPSASSMPSLKYSYYNYDVMFSRNIASYPTSQLETAIMQKTDVILAQKGTLAGASFSQNVERAIRQVEYLKTMRSGSFKDVKIKGLTEEESKAVTEFIMKSEFRKGYGSSFEQTGRPKIYQREVGDVELDLSLKQAEKIAKNYLNIKGLDKTQLKVLYENQAPSGLSYKGTKIVELKVEGFTSDLDVTGLNKLADYKLGYVADRGVVYFEGKPQASFFEQVIAKGSSSIKRFNVNEVMTIKPSSIRPKDVVDFYDEIRTYAFYNPSQSQSLLNLAEQIKTYAMKVEPGTIPLFASTTNKIPILKPESLYGASPTVSPFSNISPGAFTLFALPSPYITASPKISPSPSIKPSVSPYSSPSVSPSISPSITYISPYVSPSPSIKPSVSPSVSPSPTFKLSPSISPSPSVTPSVSPSVSPSPSPGIIPSVSPSPSPNIKIPISPLPFSPRKPPPVNVLPPIPQFKQGLLERKKKKKEPKLNLKLKKSSRFILPDMFSVIKSQYMFGTATRLPTKTAYKYERQSVGGRIPTAELVKYKVKRGLKI